jgi:hypothetical protein
LGQRKDIQLTYQNKKTTLLQQLDISNLYFNISTKILQKFSNILQNPPAETSQKLQVCNIYPASTRAAYNDLNKGKTGASLSHSNLPGATFLY